MNKVITFRGNSNHVDDFEAAKAALAAVLDFVNSGVPCEHWWARIECDCGASLVSFDGLYLVWDELRAGVDVPPRSVHANIASLSCFR